MDQGSYSSASTSTGLIRRVRDGDAAAWRELVDLYGPTLYSWCRRSDLNADEAADIVQEVFLNVSRAIKDFDHDQADSTFRGWLRRIAQNVIRQTIRNRKGHLPAEGGTDAHQRFLEISDYDLSTPSTGTAEGGLVQYSLDQLRADFEETTWQAFWLVAVDGITSTEAAERLGMTPSAVRHAKARVLRRLRQEAGNVD